MNHYCSVRFTVTRTKKNRSFLIPQKSTWKAINCWFAASHVFSSALYFSSWSPKSDIFHFLARFFRLFLEARNEKMDFSKWVIFGATAACESSARNNFQKEKFDYSSEKLTFEIFRSKTVILNKNSSVVSSWCLIGRLECGEEVCDRFSSSEPEKIAKWKFSMFARLNS